MQGDPATERPVGIEARKVAGVLAVTGLALCLANCGQTRFSGRHPSELKYGVASSPRVIPEGQPIPKGGGRDMIGKPYVVAGRTYVPHPGRGYDRVGSASWYGSAFHGRLTANGEIFDRASIAAAHPTLPLPSYVRVTNLANHRSMVVRVNDRGPYERDRVIDLSERAADALGFHRRGTSRVRVQFVGRASLGGSDDEKLLASLRTDGPASLPVPMMLATAEPHDEKPGRDDAALRLAAAKSPAAPGRLGSDIDEDDKAHPDQRKKPAASGKPEPVRIRAAELQTERRSVETIPPRRPVLSR